MENRPPLENATETPEVSPNDRVLSVRDASQVSGLPPYTLRRAEASGLLRGYRIGRSVFISELSLKELLQKARSNRDSDRSSAGGAKETEAGTGEGLKEVPSSSFNAEREHQALLRDRRRRAGSE